MTCLYTSHNRLLCSIIKSNQFYFARIRVEHIFFFIHLHPRSRCSDNDGYNVCLAYHKIHFHFFLFVYRYEITIFFNFDWSDSNRETMFNNTHRMATITILYVWHSPKKVEMNANLFINARCRYR